MCIGFPVVGGLNPINTIIGIQVQRSDADATDAADFADCSWRIDPSLQEQSSHFAPREESSRRQERSARVRCICRIRVFPLNLDARRMPGESRRTRATVVAFRD